MSNQPANCAGCGKPIRTAYCIAGLPEIKYCSRTCVDIAFEALIQAKRKEPKPAAKNILAETNTNSEESSTMETTISKEYGDAAIVRRICDRPGCGKPVELGWTGASGVYCSNKCLKSESERTSKDKIMTTETQAADMADDDSPVTAGKSADKKKKKAKAKPEPKAKKPEAKAKANGKTSTNGSGKGEQVIHLTKVESDLKGKRGQIYKLIKNGMTVSQLQEAAAKKLGSEFKSRSLVVLRTCVENNLCTVK